MDARTALKNYTNVMIKTYGANYWESWTEDDKETFNILARRVRPEITSNNPENRSNFMRRFLGIRVGGVDKPTERKEEWKKAAETAASGSRIKGKLSPQGTHANKPKRGRKAAPAGPTVEETINASGIDKRDVDSTNIMAYLLGAK